MILHRLLLFLLFSLALVIACKDSSTSVPTPSSSTINLINEANARISPANITYTLNEQRALELEAKAKQTQGIEQVNLMIRYSLEMINAGQTKTGLDMLMRIIKTCSESGIPLDNAMGNKLKSAVAIAYLRQGEQENCIQKHNHQSCIVPIGSDGIHELTQGSEGAIKMLEEVLAVDPQDYQAIWLLNLAHMTLGTYPDKIQASYLLDPSYFQQNQGIIGKFDNVASQMGIDDPRLSGAAISEDFDKDGDLDIVVSSWGIHDAMKYYENMGDHFMERGDSKGLKGYTGGLNMKPTDYNNDGFIDIYITRGAWMRSDGAIPNTLLKNNGDGTFSDVTIEAGLLKPIATQAVSWNDFNKDGWLDLVVAGESFSTTQYPTQLFINNQDGTFTDHATRAGLTKLSYFKGLSVGDLNNDGLLDIYLSSLGEANVLYMNQGIKDGIPSFSNTASTAGVELPMHSFPTMIFDFNQDGFNDILVSSFQSTIDKPAADFAMNIKGISTGGETILYLNKGDGTFENASSELGLTEAIYTMGCNYGDVNNDGFIDFYLATGDPGFSSIIPNKLYLNIEGKKLLDATFDAGVGHIQKGHGVNMLDLDMDGDLDIYTVMGGAYEGDVFQNAYFENPGNKNHFIYLELEGTHSNKLAIDAKVTVTVIVDGIERRYHHTVSSGASFGANTFLLEIGLGQAQKIEHIDVLWPTIDNTTQRFEDVMVDKMYKLKEGSKGAVELSLQKKTYNKTSSHNH